MTTEKDIYDLEVERLTANPGRIVDAWEDARPLFGFVSPTPRKPRSRRFDGEECGCLTMVRYGDCVAWTEELTEAIRRDSRLPAIADDIAPEHLPIFAEWQRRIDKELGRTPPAPASPAGHDQREG